MKILITGANGQLGQSLQSLLPEGSFVALSHQNLDISNRFEFDEALQVHKPDCVINAAAYNQVDQAETDRENAFRVNAEAPGLMAELTAKQKIPFVHVSTDYVFDGKKTEPYHEEDAPNPLSVYGESKLGGETLVLKSNAKAYVARTAWVYHQNGNNFYKKMLVKAMKGESLKVNNDQVGTPTHAMDLAAGILKLIETDQYGLVHLAGQGETTRFKMMEFLFETLGIKADLQPAKSQDFPSPAARPMYGALVTKKSPPILLPSWQDGLKRFADSLKLELNL